MKVILMNMPWMRKPGTYTVTDLTREEFVSIIKNAEDRVQETPALYHTNHFKEILGDPLPAFSLKYHELTPGSIGVACFRGQDGPDFKYFRVDYADPTPLFSIEW